MTPAPENKIYNIVLGPKTKVLEDKRTKSRIANFPFEFPDGTRGVMIVCRLKNETWNPSDDITHINLSFT